MAQHEIKLSGWQVIVAGIVIIGIFGWRLATFNDGTTDDALMEQLKIQLTSDLSTSNVANLRAAYDAGDDETVGKLVEGLSQGQFDIQTVQTSYPLFSLSGSKKVIVKVSYQFLDAQGEKQRDVKYYRYKHSGLTNSWRYEMDSGEASYYLNFF